jgi:DNA-3-methyladenine glycosylase
MTAMPNVATVRAVPRSFFARDTLDVARDLLGCLLVHAGTRGRIVETEAYRGLDDRASHASRGRTPRSTIMFGPPGYAYVYLIYGMYHCLNVVTEPEETPAAVLIRAVEPLGALAGANTSGPGRLCRAFGITREHNGLDMTRSALRIVRGSPPRRIATSPRIGVGYAGSCAGRPWRFFDPESSSVSRAPAKR